MIRPATATDAPIIAAIWNQIIHDTTITFTSEEKTPAEIRLLIADAPLFLVVTQSDRVIGFARTFPFRSGPGYRFTAEHTIMLHGDARGQGVGKRLLHALCEGARAVGIRNLIAGCSADPPGAVQFHAACGFTKVATLPAVGFKCDKWIDLVLMQKRL